MECLIAKLPISCQQRAIRPWGLWLDSTPEERPGLLSEPWFLAGALNTFCSPGLFFELCDFKVTAQQNQVFRTFTVSLS